MVQTIEAAPLLDGIDSGRVDWTDAASAPASTSADGVALARACFEGAPVALRWFLVVGWALLRLEGGPRSDSDHVLGWPAERRAGTAVCRRRSGWGIDALLVFACQQDAVVFASAMRFTNPGARLLWSVIAPVHRWAVRFVLRRAATSLDSGPSTG